MTKINIPVKQRIWRKLFWWRYLLFQRHRHNHLVVENVAGYPLTILPGVLNPKLFQTGEFLAETLNEMSATRDSVVLDMGTGSGIGAIAAAQWARQVVAIDINPTAVRCAKINALLNGVDEKIIVYEGDLFAPVCHEKFDLILFNPPYYRGKPENMMERAFYAMDVVEKFTAELRHHLTATGCALVLLSSAGDEAAFLQLFQQHAYKLTVAARRKLLTEVITLYQLRPEAV